MCVLSLLVRPLGVVIGIFPLVKPSDLLACLSAFRRPRKEGSARKRREGLVAC